MPDSPLTGVWLSDRVLTRVNFITFSSFEEEENQFSRKHNQCCGLDIQKRK